MKELNRQELAELEKKTKIAVRVITITVLIVFSLILIFSK